MNGSAQSATVRIGAVVAIPEVLRRLGADPADVLDEAGIDPRVFDNPDNRVSLAARSRLAVAYADASAFTRAFRRWSDTTPTQWRRERGALRPRGQDLDG